ncbi:MAG: hypothetical protein V1824_01440 [archaeon]
MLTAIKEFVTKCSTKILNLEAEYSSSNISEILKYESINLVSKDFDEFLIKLKYKHLINDIIITDLNGIIIGGTTKDLKESFKSAAMYNYINSEFDSLSLILIQAKNWHIIFKKDKKIYFVEANDNLTKVEVLAIVSDIENYLEKF